MPHKVQDNVIQVFRGDKSYFSPAWNALLRL